MEKYVEKTVTTNIDNTTPIVNPKVPGYLTIQNFIYFLFGLIDILLGFRLLLKLLGANPLSDFVKLIYDLTAVLIAPFEGIFHNALAKGVETTSVLEPATLVALIVYAVLAYIIVQLVQLISRKQEV